MKKAVFLAVVLVMAFCTPFAHAGAGRILNMGVEAASQASSGYNGYSDAQEETDSGISDAATDGAVTAGIVAANVVSASAAGAGSLAGYAGIASAVSSMGLGGVSLPPLRAPWAVRLLAQQRLLWSPAPWEAR